MEFYPAHLNPPERLLTAQFLLEPLRPSVNALDYEAVMASREQLRLWGGHDWPADDFSAAANLDDLAMHWREHQANIAFTYAVLALDRSSSLGCVYIRPLAEVQDHNPTSVVDFPPNGALIRFWVRSDLLSTGLEANLLSSLRGWQQSDWNFPVVLFETREANQRQVDLLEMSGLQIKYTLAMPQRGGAHVFYE